MLRSKSTGMLFAWSLLVCQTFAHAYDPIAEDPLVADKAHPPASAELKIPVADTRVNGVVYLAQGAGPHPLVLLLHGFPGNERNLDVAQALRRAGYDALYFNYRGSWGSGGKFSFASARADVAAVLAWVRSPEVAKKYGFDPARVMLLGHSMGGWLALAGAADDAKVTCTVALAPWNIGYFGARQAHGDKKALDDFVAESRSYADPEAGPLRGTTIEALAAEAKSHAADWDFRALAPALAAKHGLVITSKKDTDSSDEMIPAPLEEGLRAAHAANWTFRAFDDDHGFSAHRIQTARDAIAWFDRNCGSAR